MSWPMASFCDQPVNFSALGLIKTTDPLVSVVITASPIHFSVVENARFKGGFITRNYGAPDQNIHTVQLEINQSIYMRDDQPAELDEDKCARLRPLLKQFIGALV